MFIGHYGVGLALKKADNKISLGLLFLAVSLIDLLHYAFVLIGIESIEIVPGFTEWIPIKGNNPYTHGLTGMFIISVLTFIFVLIYGQIKKSDSINFIRAAAILSLGVFSHFLCDVLVHAPDLSIAGADSMKLGLSLWNYPIISNTVEIGMFAAGMFIYLRSTHGESFGARYGIIIFGIILTAYHFILGFVPPLKDVNIVYMNMMVTSLIIILVAEWLDRKREAA